MKFKVNVNLQTETVMSLSTLKAMIRETKRRGFIVDKSRWPIRCLTATKNNMLLNIYIKAV